MAASSEPHSHDRSEFERFKDLTRKLLDVPKAEVDKLRTDNGKPNAKKRARARRSA